MNVIYLSMYFASIGLTSIVLALSLRRSAFGVLLAVNFTGFLIGACIYPVADLFGIVTRTSEVEDFIAKNGPPGFATAIHVLLMSIGMLCGYLYRPRNGFSDRAIRYGSARLMAANEAVIWRYSILLGICSYLVYFSLVGFDVALINAAAARGGDFSGFGDKDAFLFIKTLAATGLVAACFIPAVLLEKYWFCRTSVFGYYLLALMAYTNSISRTVILSTVIVPIFVYLRLKWDVNKKSGTVASFVVSIALIFFCLVVLKYGKVMGQFISSYMSGGDYSMTQAVGEISATDAVLNGFGFQWVSVQAGVDHFFASGAPLVTQEQVLAQFFGFIPSRILSFFGADFLYYGNLSTQIACVNSSAFGYSECTVPPNAAGYSAYLLPGAGGFVIGFVMLRIYGAIERLWISIESRDYRKTWVPFFLFQIVSSFFTFIPTAVAGASAQLLWVFVVAGLRFKSSSPHKTLYGGMR